MSSSIDALIVTVDENNEKRKYFRSFKDYLGLVLSNDMAHGSMHFIDNGDHRSLDVQSISICNITKVNDHQYSFRCTYQEELDRIHNVFIGNLTYDFETVLLEGELREKYDGDDYLATNILSNMFLDLAEKIDF